MQVSKAPPSSTAIVNAPMPCSSPLLNRLPVRLALYGGGAIAVVAAAALVKYFLSQLAEQFVYSIPFLGGLLQSLELAELSNLLVFAILGLGLGALTRLLPVQWGQRLSAALLIVLVPFIFLISTQVRYDRWVQAVADQEQLSRSEAIALTNAYLDDRIQSQGWWGFYRYTARYTMLPTSQAEMQRAMGIDARVQAQFAKVTGLGTAIVTGIMTLCSWGLRLFYFVIAAIVTVSHFQDGLRSSAKRSGMSPSASPTVAPSSTPSAGPASPRATPSTPRPPKSAAAKATATKATKAKSAAKAPARAATRSATRATAPSAAKSAMKSSAPVFPPAATTPPKPASTTSSAKPQPGQAPQSQPSMQEILAKPPASQPTPPSRPSPASPPAGTQQPPPPPSP